MEFPFFSRNKRLLWIWLTTSLFISTNVTVSAGFVEHDEYLNLDLNKYIKGVETDMRYPLYHTEIS